MGSLSKHLLACSLYELGYLKAATPDYFTDCLWSIVNPRRALTVTNAVVYDVLLLLTYKVTLSVPQLTTALSEYLHRMYVEQLQIDVDKFSPQPQPPVDLSES